MDLFPWIFNPPAKSTSDSSISAKFFTCRFCNIESPSCAFPRILSRKYLLFSVTEKQKQVLKQLDVETEDDEVILSRRITGGRGVSKVNGESVPASKVKEIASVLIDIHGQHEHQSPSRLSICVSVSSISAIFSSYTDTPESSLSARPVSSDA